jgi:hypothetical protein
MSDPIRDEPNHVYMKRPQSYRRGFVEGEAGERNCYRLQDGADDSTEYEQGFLDGLKRREVVQP